jgi:hypothetical protein
MKLSKEVEEEIMKKEEAKASMKEAVCENCRACDNCENCINCYGLSGKKYYKNNKPIVEEIVGE